MLKRILSIVVLGVMGVGSLEGATGLGILSVMTRNYGVNDFTRISEYFTGVEDNGCDTVLRTDVNARGGVYLVIGLNRGVSRLGEGAVLRFRYLMSGCNEERERVFSLEGGGSSPWIFVGVTGGDLVGGCLVAWSVEVQACGECVGWDSYLWGRR